MSDSEEEFEEQLRQEARASQIKDDAGEEEIEEGRTKTDPDGTVYEWDAQKKAWFPKIDDDFIAQYQMNYGTDNAQADSAKPSEETSSVEAAARHQAYWDYYNQYYNQYDEAQAVVSSEGQNVDSSSGQSETEENLSSAKSSTNEADSTTGQDSQEYFKQYYGSHEVDKDQGEYSEEYWKYYYKYYNEYSGQTQPQNDAVTASTSTTDTVEDTSGNKTSEENSKESKEAAKKRKAKEEVTWFDADEEKTTSVYVSGLPSDITEAEFKDMMAKCGLILYDHVKRGLKLKLYKDEEGNFKGDGLCGYIKPESVQLAFQILDGSELRGSTIKVQRAKFTLKGEFDPSKKRRKLTNKEKRKIKEKQQKLFDWRPDKMPGERPKSDRVVIIKNAFRPEEFEKDPVQINVISQDLRSECAKYGEVKKVKIYDRNQDGIASISMAEPEEADVCVEAINGRWFGGRQLEAATWDGKTRYGVQETEEELRARDEQWERFLKQEQEEAAKESGKKAAEATAEKPTLNSQSDVKKESSASNSNSDEAVISETTHEVSETKGST